MGLRPTFRIEANGSDITDIAARRLVSLDLTDEAGYRSDEVTIVLADPASEIELPEKGAELSVWLGYDDANTLMGVYVVDEITVAFPPRQLSVKAKASPQATGSPSGYVPLQTQFTRSWNAGTTLGDMARRIAGDHGLRAVIDADLDAIELPHVDQVDESNVNLLTRLARVYDATAKPAAGRLIIARRATGISATGEDIPPVVLRPKQITRARATISGRFTHGQVIATYRDQAAAADVEVPVGQGEPVRRLRHSFTSREEAEAAAAAEIARGQRGERKLTVSCPGDPDLQAEGLLVMLECGAGIDGAWTISKVRHSLSSSGYTCDIECEATRAGGGTGGGENAAFRWLRENYPWLYDPFDPPIPPAEE